MNELNHINGKGDKVRSPHWNKTYDEIKWTGTTGFVRVNAARIRKSYGKSACQSGFQLATALQYSGFAVEGERAVDVPNCSCAGGDSSQRQHRHPNCVHQGGESIGDSVPAAPPGEYSSAKRGGNASL